MVKPSRIVSGCQGTSARVEGFGGKVGGNGHFL